jgi:four helix bundle protein
MGEAGYKKLIVWQKGDELTYQIYMETKKFTREEMYGVTSQLRRAALSIPTNLVEGTGRQGKKELKQFANIALGSVAEAEYLLDFSLRLGYFFPRDA